MPPGWPRCVDGTVQSMTDSQQTGAAPPRSPGREQEAMARVKAVLDASGTTVSRFVRFEVGA